MSVEIPRARSVTEVTALVRDAVSAKPELEDLLVEGEISNYSAPSSGHLYFTLKDRQSALSCVCFRAAAMRIPFRPDNGMVVTVHGRLDIYEQQGRYQLYVDSVEPSGVGALALAVEQRKRALAAEGLFDERLKRPLPLLPRRVVVVTSRSGAAFHDVVTVMGRRAPCVDVVLSPATVQGEGAAETLVLALRRAASVRDADLVLLVRGGGSLEDLMAFNDEALARAIRQSPLPVVCGVGHETDITIADLVADRRAPTPSAAAELCAPSCAELHRQLDARSTRLTQAARRTLEQRRGHIERLRLRLDQLSPSRRVAGMRQEVDGRAARLRAALLAEVATKRRHLDRSQGTLELHSPLQRLPRQREGLEHRRARLSHRVAGLLERDRQGLQARGKQLAALSPLRVLERGYSITTDAASGRVLRDPAELAAGARLHTRLRRGSLESVVESVDSSDEQMYDPTPGEESRG